MHYNTLYYSISLAVIFIETPIFRRRIAVYLTDERLRDLQNELLLNPEKGARFRGGGGLRKVRFADPARGKGKRGGLRIIYYWKVPDVIYLLLVYDKDKQDDLSPQQIKILRELMKE